METQFVIVELLESSTSFVQVEPWAVMFPVTEAIGTGACPWAIAHSSSKPLNSPNSRFCFLGSLIWHLFLAFAREHSSDDNALRLNCPMPKVEPDTAFPAVPSWPAP